MFAACVRARRMQLAPDHANGLPRKRASVFSVAACRIAKVTFCLRTSVFIREREAARSAAAATTAATTRAATADRAGRRSRRAPGEELLGVGRVLEPAFARPDRIVEGIGQNIALPHLEQLLVAREEFQRQHVLPLGLIGVVASLLMFGRPLGFVAILGILALLGMIAKNAVILIVQIEEDRASGLALRDAVVASATSRLRPMMLTALSTVLGLIPIAPTVFWGPMAFAIMGGLLVATLLTLVVLPALYVASLERQSDRKVISES